MTHGRSEYSLPSSWFGVPGKQQQTSVNQKSFSSRLPACQQITICVECLHRALEQVSKFLTLKGSDEKTRITDAKILVSFHSAKSGVQSASKALHHLLHTAIFCSCSTIWPDITVLAVPVLTIIRTCNIANTIRPWS